jgi:hypothetical protein
LPGPNLMDEHRRGPCAHFPRIIQVQAATCVVGLGLLLRAYRATREEPCHTRQKSGCEASRGRAQHLAGKGSCGARRQRKRRSAQPCQRMDVHKSSDTLRMHKGLTAGARATPPMKRCWNSCCRSSPMYSTIAPWKERRSSEHNECICKHKKGGVAAMVGWGHRPSNVPSRLDERWGLPGIRLRGF